MLLDNRKTQVIEVEVTQADIDKAVACKVGFLSQRCPIAQALNRSLGGRWGVDHHTASNFAARPFTAHYEHDGRDMVLAFDLGYEDVTPGVVRLEGGR